MTDQITTNTIKSERFLAATLERVFQAWADREQRLEWDVPGNDWVIAEFQQDFREDGIETSRFGPQGDPVAESFGQFLNIDPPRRIVSAGVMRSARTGEVSSATMMTLHLEAERDGTRLSLIDQSVFSRKGRDSRHAPTWLGRNPRQNAALYRAGRRQMTMSQSTEPNRQPTELDVFLGEWRAEGTSYGGTDQSGDDPKANREKWESEHKARWHTGGYFQIEDERARPGGAVFDTHWVRGIDPETGRMFASSFENHGHKRTYD